MELVLGRNQKKRHHVICGLVKEWIGLRLSGLSVKVNVAYSTKHERFIVPVKLVRYIPMNIVILKRSRRRRCPVTPL